VSEAVTNAVVHAYRRGRPGAVGVCAWVQDPYLVVRVTDRGTGMRPHPEWSGLGLGIELIRSIAEEATFDSSDEGVAVTMTFLCPGEALDNFTTPSSRARAAGRRARGRRATPWAALLSSLRKPCPVSPRDG
jgi:hypothetical protein